MGKHHMLMEILEAMLYGNRIPNWRGKCEMKKLFRVKLDLVKELMC